MKRRSLVLVLCAALFMVGCAQNSGVTSSPAGIQIGDAWARAAAMNSDAPGTDAKVTSAMYLTIQNGGAADILLKAESEVAQVVELHNVFDVDGMIKMRPAQGIDVPAHGAVELKPGGSHVMLIGLKRDLRPGDTIDLVLTFEKAGKQTVYAVVRAQ